MILLDANIILRYLVDEDVEALNKAEEYIRRKDAFITAEVIEEVIYVLQKVYYVKRSKISSLLVGVITSLNVNDKEVIILALEVFGRTNLDFVDCVLFAYHKLSDSEIATFDKQLIKLIARSDNGEII